MTTKLRLDRSRSVGQICPPDPHPTVKGAVAHYTQDGFFFDHEGKLIEAFLTDEQKKQLAGKNAPKPPNPAAPAGSKAPMTRREKIEAQAPAKHVSGGDDLNLEMWLRGEAQYQEFRVRKVVRDRYNRVCASTQELVRFLVDENTVVPSDALKPEFREFYKQDQGAE